MKKSVLTFITVVIGAAFIISCTQQGTTATSTTGAATAKVSPTPSPAKKKRTAAKKKKAPEAEESPSPSEGIFSCADTVEGPSKFLILELRAQLMDAPVESGQRSDQDHP